MAIKIMYSIYGLRLCSYLHVIKKWVPNENFPVMFVMIYTLLVLFLDTDM